LNIQDYPEKKDYNIVGITGMSAWKKEIIGVAEKYPQSCVIVGGPWATVSPAEVLSYDSVDYVCVGDGEEVWSNFLKAFPNVENVKGLAFKKNGKFVHNVNSELVKDFSRYPLPAWNLVPLSKYKRVGIMTSRGCPYRCIFCINHLFGTRVWRGRKPYDVLAEIAMLVDLGAKEIIIADDCPTMNKTRFTELLQGIIDRKFKVKFLLGNTRVDQLTLPMLDLLKQAGFHHICISPENGVQRVLDEVIHKHLDLKGVEPIVKKAVGLGMTVQAYFVIGFPHESKTDIEQTLAYTKKLRALGANTTVQNALPYRGTQLYEESKKEGSLRFDDEVLDDILVHRSKFEKVHTLTCLRKPYWTPEYVIQQRSEEVKRGRRETLRKRSFSMYALKMLISNPRYVLKFLKETIRVS
jgi:radical SAM superfamily enzyme YgiQ (UPF0313 family)